MNAHYENCASVNGPLVLWSQGGNGNTGSSADFTHGGTGGRGDDGGVLVLTNQVSGGIADGILQGKVVLGNNSYSVPISGNTLSGLTALSIAGNGGNGGEGHFVADGGAGGSGGNGGVVTVVNAGSIFTTRRSSAAMYGLSQGGEGGGGGSGGFLFGGGGSGGTAGNAGGDVTGFNSGKLLTTGDQSSGISMHSVGGRGGEGGTTAAGFYAVGGNGAQGGLGGTINAINQGVLSTTGRDSKGISALSIGGGGGDGGSAFAAGVVAGVAIGGYGGNGGKGGQVYVVNGGNNIGSITTTGMGSLGIRAQSIGGGGGDGGSATAVAAGPNLSFTLAIGGSGGNGGDGDHVSVDNSPGSSITTGSANLQNIQLTKGLILPGDYATGILAQSVGGGGGNGHQAFTMSAAAGEGASVAASVALGGSGGNGGKGGFVVATSLGSISTTGRFASGILAQSIGGGGGNGGNTIALDASVSNNVAGTIKFALAGAGGSGDSGGAVDTTLGGSITTIGQGSAGFVSQSIAGGGGNGGNTFDASLSVGKNAVNIGVSMGGSGGGGAQSGSVQSNVKPNGAVTTYGDMAAGAVTQSIGGGGGNGGSVQTYAVSAQGGKGAAGNVNVDIGGKGGNGGVGGAAQQVADGAITTFGNMSTGALVQSIGGGGGNGGHVYALDVAASLDSSSKSTQGQALQANVTIGGNAGPGAFADAAALTLVGGAITTSGLRSAGAMVQSIGGGGGNGGSVSSYSVSTSLPSSAEGLSNRLKSNFDIFMSNLQASDEEKAKNKSFENKSNLDVAVNIGGSGGGGGAGGAATANLAAGTVTTGGNLSHGLVVQSIGGGGGTGGNSVADGFAGISSYGLNVKIGGHGGAGSSGGAVVVQQQSGQSGTTTINTSGDQSYGVLAQSIGGGGGEGGSTHAKFSSVSGLSGTSVTFGLGGTGGTGNLGGAVLVRDVSINTRGAIANGIVAQSIGGGGGAGNVSDGSGSQISLGGSGGSGNNGGTVSVAAATVSTTGAGAAGVVAQSIGGGGGNAGASSVGALLAKVNGVLDKIFNLDVQGSAGTGGSVNIGCQSATSSNCRLSVNTTGASAIGVFAQSIGGGGGLVQMTNISPGALHLNVFGLNPTDGRSGKVSIMDSNSSMMNVATTGNGAIGIAAQSFDSGGQTFILDTTHPTVNASSTATELSANGGVAVDLHGSVMTGGNNAPALFVQSLTHAFSVLASDGQYSYGGQSINTSTNQIIVRNGAILSTSGANSNGVSIQTNSITSAAYTPSNGSSPSGVDLSRSQTININGQINVAGSGSWGIYSTNSNRSLGVSANASTTYITIGANASVTAQPGAAGGIFVNDYGNAAVEVNGTVTATSGSAISMASQNNRLSIFGNYNLTSYATVKGNVNINGIGPGSTSTVNVDGLLYGALIINTNGGSSSISGGGYIGQYQGNGSAPRGKLAISVDSGINSINIVQVYGNVIGPKINSSNIANPVNLNINNMYGSINGPFNYILTQYGTMEVDGTGQYNDSINVVKYTPPAPAAIQNGGGITIQLTALPTPNFKPVTLINVAGGMPSGGSPESIFGIAANTPVTHYIFSASTPSSGPATLTLNSISIDFTRAGTRPGLIGNIAAVEKLANRQVQAVVNGTAQQDPSSALYRFLLFGANAGGASSVQDYLEVLEPSLHYGTLASADAARTAGLDALQSCGGQALASIDPISQGQCNWGKFTANFGSLLNGMQRFNDYGLAFGHQFQLADKWYFGVSGSYESTRSSSATARSLGYRLGLGAILKYSAGDNFASISTRVANDQTHGTRTITALSDPTTVRSATMDQDIAIVATRLRAGHRFDMHPLDITPKIDLDVAMLHDYGYTERGADDFNIKVPPSTNVLFDLHPAVEIGGHTKLGSVNIRAFGEIGGRFALNDIQSRASLANGFDPDYQITVQHRRERSLATYGLGMVIDATDRLEARLNYEFDRGSQERIQTVSAKVAFKF